MSVQCACHGAIRIGVCRCAGKLPLADIKAFNIQNYYIGAFTGPGNATGNQFVLRLPNRCLSAIQIG